MYLLYNNRKTYSHITVDNDGDFWIHGSDWKISIKWGCKCLQCHLFVFYGCHRKDVRWPVWVMVSPTYGSDNVPSSWREVGWCHCPRNEAMGSSGRQRFMRKASISSSVGAFTCPKLLYGLFLSSSCNSASTCFTRLSSASNAWEEETDGSQPEVRQSWDTNRNTTIPSSVFPFSSLHFLNHCCQRCASCSFCFSFSSSLSPSYLCASKIKII